MDTLKAIQKARAALILDQPFFGALALRLQLLEDATAATMKTNGIHLKYNPAFVDALSLDQLKGVLCHEVLHLAAGHHVRRGNRDPRRWNEAADYAINQIIMDAKMQLPADVLLDPQYAGLAADHIYAKLGPGPDEGDDPNQGPGPGQGPQQGPGQAPGQPGPGQPSSDPGGCGEIEDFPGSDPAQGASQAELEQQAQEWQIAATQAAQAAKNAGKLPGSLARLIEDINEPKVNWRETLQRFISQAARNDYTWKRPNPRYFANGIVLPSLFNEELPPVVVAVDTSGSIQPEDLQQFAGEIDEIIRQYNATVTVIYCDTKIQHVETFTIDDLPLKLDAKGGGGTKFSPVMDWTRQQEEDPTCVIYLTDMECYDFGEEPACPVLWIQTDGRKKEAPYGEVICM